MQQHTPALFRSSVALLWLAAALPAQGAWTVHRQMDTRVAPIVFDAGRDRVVLFGGLGRYSFAVADTWEWDGVKWMPRTPQTSPPPREGHSLTYDDVRGEVVLFGGSISSETWVWNGVDWTQRVPAPSPPARSYHGMAHDATRGVGVMFGGSDGVTQLGDTWEWTGSAWVQRAPANAPSAREASGMAFDPVLGRVLLFGGRVAGGSLSNETWTWNGTDWALTDPPTKPPATAVSGMATDPTRGRVVLYLRDRSVWEWNGANWTGMGSNPDTPPQAKLAFDGANDEIFAFGDGNHTQAWTWNGTRWALVGGNPHRNYVTMAYDVARSRTVAFTPAAVVEGAWEWADNRWFPVAATRVPQHMNELSYDSARQRVVMPSFGATGLELWAWDGSDWTVLPSHVQPTNRWTAATAYDSARNRLVMFGGSTGTRETWEFGANGWIRRNPATSPPPRDGGHEMAYDPIRQKTLLYGGFNGLIKYQDTWEWDGNNWTRRTPSTQPTNWGPSMVFDPRIGRIVMTQGSSTTFGDCEIHEWDGNDWIRQPNAQTGTPSAVAYNAARQSLQLYGGGYRTEETWFHGGASAAVAVYGSGCSGAVGTPRLTAFGEPHIGETRFALDVSGARANAPCALLLATSSANLPLGRCTLLVSPAAVSVPGATSSAGFTAFPLSVPELPSIIGLSVFAQAGIADPAGALGVVALTGGVQLGFGE